MKVGLNESEKATWKGKIFLGISGMHESMGIDVTKLSVSSVNRSKFPAHFFLLIVQLLRNNWNNEMHSRNSKFEFNHVIFFKIHVANKTQNQ